MQMTVTGPGRIRAADAVEIDVPRNTQGELQLVYLITEGTVVEEGQVVALLDTVAAVERLETARDQLETAEAAYTQLLEDHANQIKDLENRVRSAELSYQQSELQLQALEFSSELDKQQGALNLENARISRDEASRQLEAQKIINEAERTQETISLEGRRRDAREVVEELEALTIRSPIGGMVIHAEQGRFFSRVKVREGDTVRRGQELIELPDLSEIQAVVTINELDGDRVEKGQSARVRLEAYPREVFAGHVTDISTLAQQMEDSGNVRVFPAVVTLDEPDPRLRPGMTASAEIVVDELPDVLMVPLAACGVGGGRCLVMKVRESEPIEVELGLRNESVAQVISGLEEGDRVQIGWQEDPAAVLAALAGHGPIPEQTAQQIVSQGDSYGKTAGRQGADTRITEEGMREGMSGMRMRPGEEGGMGGRAGGAGGDRMRTIDPSQLSPEMRARFEQMRSGQSDEGRQRQSGGEQTGERRAGGFMAMAMGDSTQITQYFEGLRQRAEGLPDSLKTEVNAFIESRGATMRGLSRALRDSLRAWGGFGQNRTQRRPPPTGEVEKPPEVLQGGMLR
jgi:RND family efflux transporter MFP subunit